LTRAKVVQVISSENMLESSLIASLRKVNNVLRDQAATTKIGRPLKATVGKQKRFNAVRMITVAIVRAVGAFGAEIRFQ